MNKPCSTFGCHKSAVFRTKRVDRPSGDERDFCEQCFTSKVSKYEMTVKKI